MSTLDTTMKDRVRTLNNVAYDTENAEETYNQQLDLIYKWVKTGVINKQQFKRLLDFVVG